MLRTKWTLVSRVILVSLWIQTDFGGKIKIIQVYERYDVANKMQIEQHWVIPQTVPYSEQRNWKQQKKQQKKKQQNLKNCKVRFRLNIDVRKEKEDPRLYAITQLITFVKVDWILAARVQQQLMLTLRNLF